jgi:hypothetical protein
VRLARSRAWHVPLALLCVLWLCGAAFALPLRVAVVSDLNGAYGSTRYGAPVRGAVAAVLRGRPDLVLGTGDMVAGQRRSPPLGAEELESMWAGFHAAVSQPLRAAGIPFAVTPGNHDASAYAAFRAERETYRAQWLPRRPALEFLSAEGYPFDYAFALGGVLFVSLDVTTSGALPASQRQWLDGVLRQHGPAYRYRVVFSHLPIRAFTFGREAEMSGDAGLEQLLRQHGVDVYLSGHHHAFYPGLRNGVRYVGQACLGAGPRPLIGTSVPQPRAITWLEFRDDGLQVDAYAGKEFDRRIDRAMLPTHLGEGDTMMVRDDLGPPGSARGATP